MSKRLAHSHFEAVANTVAGSAIAQLILWLWGLPLMAALGLNATFLAASYARSFIIRRIFARWEAR